jgi:serine/threonine protein kinase/tetratricopeptide (TPR) repeat protein
MRARISTVLFDEPVVGERFAHYEILRRIGTGGMGVVYLARDTRLDRKVALKLVRQRALSAQSRHRLVLEAKTLAKLNHPNIVQVYEVGEHGDDVYVAMEHVEGSTLFNWQYESKPSRAALLQAYRAAAMGLAAAHGAGVIHRDFKASNVLMGADGRIRVADFGLALSQAGIDGQDDPGTGLVGTPGYLAPELFGGGRASPQSDQFSFCVSLWEMLTGTRPEATPSHTSRVELRPAWLRRVVVRGLDPDPRRRWPDMDSLRMALDRRKRQQRWATGGLLVTGLLGGVGLSALFETQSDPCADPSPAFDLVWSEQRRASVHAQMLAADKPWVVDLAEPLELALDKQRDEWIQTRESLCRATFIDGVRSEENFDRGNLCLERHLDRIESLLTLIEEDDEQVLLKFDDLLIELGEPGRCVEASGLATALDERRRPQIGQAGRELDALSLRVAGGDYRETPARVQAIVERSSKLDAPHLHAEALEILARIEGDQLAVEQAIDTNELAELAGERCAADDLRFRAQCRLVALHGGSLDGLDQARGWYARAEATFGRLGSPAPLRVELLLAQAELATASRELDLAIAELEAALALAESLGLDQARLDRIQLVLANRLAEAKHWGPAIERYEQLAAANRRRLGPGHPDVARVEFNLGFTLTQSGAIESAIKHLELALELQARAHGERAFLLEPTLVLLGQLRLAMGEFEKARAFGLRAQALDFESLSTSDPARVNGARLIAHTHIAQGEFAAALATDEAALTKLDPNHVSLAKLRADLEQEIGWLLCRLGRHDEAEPHLERASRDGDAEVQRFASLTLADVALAQGMPKRALEHLDEVGPLAADEEPEFAAEYRWLRARVLIEHGGPTHEIDALIGMARDAYRELPPRPDIESSLETLAKREE